MKVTKPKKNENLYDKIDKAVERIQTAKSEATRNKYALWLRNLENALNNHENFLYNRKIAYIKKNNPLMYKKLGLKPLPTTTVDPLRRPTHKFKYEYYGKPTGNYMNELDYYLDNKLAEIKSESGNSTVSLIKSMPYLGALVYNRLATGLWNSVGKYIRPAFTAAGFVGKYVYENTVKKDLDSLQNWLNPKAKPYKPIQEMDYTSEWKENLI